jgi:hypothetical protein
MQRSGRVVLWALALGLVLSAPALAPAFAQDASPAQGDAVSLEPPIPDPGGAPDAAAADEPSALPPAPPPVGHRPTGVAGRLASWVSASGDNGPRPFMIVDKLGAEVFAFDADGVLLGSAPALVGLAPGDDSAPGIGDLQLSAISPDERTTPAGRFVATFGPSTHGTVLWVDFADAISMHPVITTNPAEHRLQRIRSASPDDHRISFGCINVPAKFYHSVVVKAFAAGGIVYILPDTKPVEDVFPALATAVDASAEIETASHPDRCAVSEAGPSTACPSDGSQTTDESPVP